MLHMVKQSANKINDVGKIVILGAGPTGLGAAYRLKELGYENFTVIEKLDHVGGLASSFVDKQGFTWDIGGHVLFSHYAYFDKLMASALPEKDWLKHERESWIWTKDTFVPYPFQNNIRHLPKEVMLNCLNGLIKSSDPPQLTRPANFREWIIATFGKGIADEFMFPYNLKVWAYPLEQMSYQWIGERVSVVDLNRVLENIKFNKDDVSWGPNDTFQFPRKGGTGAIWNGVADLIGREKFRLNTEVIRISNSLKKCYLRDESTISYDLILNTTPLDILVSYIDDLSTDINSLACKLQHSTSNIVGIGLKGAPKKDLKGKCWMYFPGLDCPFYRATVFSHYSPNNVPDIRSYWSLMTETSESSYRKISIDGLIDETIEGLLNTRLIEHRDQVVSSWIYRATHGYPIPSLGRDGIIEKVLPALEDFDIYSRGRFGAWKYEVSNQDHSLMQGVEWVDRVLLDIPETTVFSPDIVNKNGKYKNSYKGEKLTEI